MSLDHQINEEAFNGMNSAVQEHYEKDGDNYYLQAVGLVPKSKVDQFRDNNIDLKKTNETQTTTITDLTGQLKIANEGSSEEKVNQLVEAGLGKRTKSMKDDMQKTIDDLTAGKTKSDTALSSLLVSDAVNREAIAAGVKDTALEDVLTRASRVFKVVDGKATPYSGDDVIYGKDGTTPMTVKDWLAGQAATAPHLFKESTGGGATNKNKGGGATPKLISRADFEAKNAIERMGFVKNGGKVTD